MKLFAIVYDISDSKRDHTTFLETIQSLGAWMHYMDTLWIISTNEFTLASEVFGRLHPHMDQEEDYVFVAEVPSNVNGWLPPEAWDWIEKQRSASIPLR